MPIVVRGRRPVSGAGAYRFSNQPTLLAQLFALLGLTGFAISEQMLALLGENPTFFTFHNVDGVSILWLGLAIALVPPFVLWLIGVSVGAIHRHAGTVVHLLTVSILVGLSAIQLLKQVGLETPTLILSVAIVAGVIGGVVYRRFRIVAMWLQLTAILPALALGSLLFVSETSDLLRSPRADTAGSFPQQATDLPTVVFVLLDELPTKSIIDIDDNIDAVRFRNFAAFAEDATWYRHYTTQAPFTSTAVPNILSGTDPKLEEPLWTNYPDNLFTMFAATHRLIVFESLTELCALEACREGLLGSETGDPRFGDLIRRTIELWRERISLEPKTVKRLDDFDEKVVGVTTVDVASTSTPVVGKAPAEDGGNLLDILFGGEALRNRPARQQEFVDTLVPGDQPTLHFLHLVLPHSPFRYYEDGTAYEVAQDTLDHYPFQFDNKAEWLSVLAEQRHLLQAEYADRLFGEIVAAMKTAGMYDDALVILAADHGASFETDTDYRLFSEETLDSVAYVPLMVKVPGQTEGRVDDSNLMAVDVVPTIADLVGISLTWDVDGHPAGSAGIDARGDRKYAHDIVNPLFGQKLRGIIEFDARAEFPDAADRWIASIPADADKLAALNARLDLDHILGRPFAEVATPGEGGDAVVYGLSGMREQSSDSVPYGVVAGRVADPLAKGKMVVSVNGTIVAGSPLFDRDDAPGHFAAMLPKGVLAVGRNDIRLGLVSGEEVVEMRAIDD